MKHVQYDYMRFLICLGKMHMNESNSCGPSMKLYNWIKTYENWLILFILTRCNFFSKVCTVIVGGKMPGLILNLGVMFNSLSAYLNLR